MEGWGRGIPDIYDLCKAAGMPEPEFDFVPNFVCLTIWFKTPITPYMSGCVSKFVNGDVNGQLNGELNDELNDELNGELNSSQKSTLQFILEHEGCTASSISEKTGIPFSTIDKHIRVLLKAGVIERRGGKKTGGYYSVVKM